MLQPEWKATEGYSINKENGTAERYINRACTLHFYLAKPGDRLHLSDRSYEYAVATYQLKIDPRFIYTYDYQKEENWTEYRRDSDTERFTQGDYLFTEKLYFRVILRKSPSWNENHPSEAGWQNMEEKVQDAQKACNREGSFGLEAILEWREAAQQNDADGVLAGEASRIPLNPDIRNEVEDTARSVCEIQTSDSLNFLLMTDNHYTVNGTWDDTASHLYAAVAELKAHGVKTDGFIHLGDTTDGMMPAEVTRDYVVSMQEDINGLGLSLYYVIGNHDSNYFRNNPERFSQEEILSLYLPGRSKCYYYADYPEQHLRMIFLESFDPDEQIRYGFSDEELDWLEELLHHQTLPDWYVLIFSHVPPTPRLHYWSKEIRGSRRLLRILREYQIRSAAVDNADMAEDSDCDSVGSYGHLLGFIHGHNHADQIDCKEGFPIISIGCNKCEYFEDKKPEGAVAYKRTLGRISQDLWDVLTISVRSGTLDFTRFGAGGDRHVSWKDYSILWKDCCVSWEGRRKEKLLLCHGQENSVSGQETDNGRGQFPVGGREKTMKKVITYGTFDLFHEGHYNILKRAKELGDYLIVGVTTEHYDEQRGKINIVDPLLERIENVRNTGLVDEIIIEDHEGQKIEDVQKYDVDIFTLGSDWRGTFDYLKAYCQVVYLERTPDISSTMLRKGKFPIIRIGIVGSGRIAPRFIAEAKYVSGLNVQCVYNPHRESAERFGREYYLDSYSDEFEDFLNAVDAIYIAAPHETHYTYARSALLAGKHVLCEKPLAFQRSQAEELFSLARERQLVLMEGIKTAYCPGFAQLISIAKSGKIGEIRDVEACFSRLTDPRMREMVDVRYGGAFLEFGSYTVLPIVKLLGLKYDKIKISSILAENGVDLYTKIYFDYANGMATSKTGLGVKSEGQLLISGTKGYILAESPWWLTRKFQVRYEDPNQIETYTPNFLGDGLRYEIGEFAMRINGRGGHLFKLTEEETLAMADVVEQFMEERKRQRMLDRKKNREAGVRIWAHRGASWLYPENTLAAFQAACELPGLTGIELDIQLSRNGELVVFHDETLNRLMDTEGNVRDFTLGELQQMRFKDWKEEDGHKMVRIPSMREVLELVKPYTVKCGIQINIELKNSKIPYEGMEEKILSLVAEYGMGDFVVYSSFNAQSVRHLKELDGSVRTGILHPDIRECLRLVSETGADAVHPDVDDLLESGGLAAYKPEEMSGCSIREQGGAEDTGSGDVEVPVRVWNCKEPFYGQVQQYLIYDLQKLRRIGVTDFITNIPEEYLND